MYKRIDLTKLGGYPLAQEDLDWLQTSYRDAFAALADMIGDKVIISGMDEVAGNVSAGWISIGGEIVPFAAGAIGTGEFIIQETKLPLIFNDGNAKDVLISRLATFSGGGGFQYADLVRLGTVKELSQPGDTKEISCDQPYIDANFDGTGLGINKRKGWAICNGENGTIDMGKQFSVGYKKDDPDYGVPGGAGGVESVQLASSEQGKFTVAAKDDDLINGSAGGGGNAHVRLRFNGVEVPDGGANASTWGANLNVSLSGATDAHTNLPPFKILLRIQKL